MTNGMRATLVLVVFVAGLAGCDSGSSSTPSSPSPLPPAVPLATGQIALTTNPPSGATLMTSQCPGDEDFYFPCTRDLQLVFSVAFNRDIARARVWVEFYTAIGKLCATTSTGFDALLAGTSATLITGDVVLSHQDIAGPMCALPVETTRIRAQLLDFEGRGSSLLTQEFPSTYTFALP